MSDDADNKMALPPGTVLHGKYRLESVLGHGGFGITYKAKDTSMNRHVAIKECLPSDYAWREGTTVLPKATQYREDFQWARERFMDEARTLAKFDHPAIVKVYDIFDANGTSYMVTRYELGDTLKNYLQTIERKLMQEEIQKYILHPLLDGLEQVHEAGYLHRDIKPANIYITNEFQPVLLDFGAARQAVGHRSRPMTSVRTDGYAPFEQYLEEGNQGPWSDLYALAACIHYMLRNEPPPDATRRERKDPYEPLAQDNQLLKSYERNLLVAIDQCLSRDESHRPQSVPAVREVLDRVGMVDSEPVKEDSEPKSEDAEWLFEEAEAYFHGWGRSKDDAKAVEFYRKAAEQGHAEAQFCLGYMYREGVGIPKNNVKAVEWYRKAAEQGHAMAKEVLAKQNPSNAPKKETNNTPKNKPSTRANEPSPIQLTQSKDSAVVEKEAREYFSSLGIDPDLRVKDENFGWFDAAKEIGGGIFVVCLLAVMGAGLGAIAGVIFQSEAVINLVAIGGAIWGAIWGVKEATKSYKLACTIPILSFYAKACAGKREAVADIANYLRSEGKKSEAVRWDALRKTMYP